MELLHLDEDIVVCIKPARVLSTDEPGGLPELLRQQLALPEGDFRTVHRLDRVVSGVMVLARNVPAASELSRQIRQGGFEKAYQAIVHGCPEQPQGELEDLLYRDKARKMTMVAREPGKGVQPARLGYQVLGTAPGFSRVWIRLYTGRTHQIRVQFASRGMPLAGERKYGVLDDPWQIALWSSRIGFSHPRTGEKLVFSQEPPAEMPWTMVPGCAPPV